MCEVAVSLTLLYISHEHSSIHLPIKKNI